MTNKRKKLARSISAKTGMSYAGAINSLGKEQTEEGLFSSMLTTDLEGIPVPRTKNLLWYRHYYNRVEDLFSVDHILGAPAEVIGGFRRESDLACYTKAPEATAYVVGGERDHIIAVQKPRKVFVPVEEHEFETKEHWKGPKMEPIREWMFELIGAVSHDEDLPEVKKEDLEAYFDEKLGARIYHMVRVSGDVEYSGMLLKPDLPEPPIQCAETGGVLGKAGTKVSKIVAVTPHAGILAIKGECVGLVLFSDWCAAVKVV